MRRLSLPHSPVLVLLFTLSAAIPSALAQGTRLWTTAGYEQMERGTTAGVAIASDGALRAGPTSTLLYQAPGNLAWAVAADSSGDAFLGLGNASAGGAKVLRISPDGKSTPVFAGKELGVQALHRGEDGHIYAVTSPDGSVYRLGATPADAAVVFAAATTAEHPKYLWDVAQASDGALFVATGAPAIVYRVPPGGGPATVLFGTADQHIRCLLLAPDGALWAGSDGSGVVYRIDTRDPQARPFAAYSAPKKEITALARDDSGAIYAAGVGVRTPSAGPTLPPLAVTGSVGVTISFSQPGAAPGASSLIPEGSEIYRIAPDGSPSQVVALREDIVYALAFDRGSLLAATGNRGRIYRIDPEGSGEFSDVAHLEAAQAIALTPAPGGWLAATANSARLYRLQQQPAAKAVYTSEVFDARTLSQWGRVETEPAAPSPGELFVRTGNVESPLLGWSDWTPVRADGSVSVAPSRFAQWKAELHGDSSLSCVGWNYLEKNLAPVVDQIVVQPGARVPSSSAAASSPAIVSISFPAPASALPAISFTGESPAAPLQAQRDPSAVTVRWAAHDDNGDDLMFSVWYRGAGEHDWRLLRDKISDRFLSFDAGELPDGRYQIRVVASDAPDHTDADTLTGEKISGEFLIDTAPPQPGVLSATLLPGTPVKLHATFSARDATSPIAHAEYAVDGGPWQYLEPVGRISDSLEERYDFVAVAPPVTAAGDAREHVLAVRVYDRAENVATAKTVVR